MSTPVRPIPSQVVNKTGDISKWRESTVFDPEQFGPAVHSGAVTEGRFAYTPTSSNAHNLTDIVNAYGYIRAPWNQNSNPYLTRFNQTYGFELTAVPSCFEHKTVLEMTTFSDFGFYIAYAPHGTTHMMIGGIGGANYKNILKANNYDLGMGEAWVPTAFAFTKNMYRAGYIDCPVTCSADTKMTDCKVFP